MYSQKRKKKSVDGNVTSKKRKLLKTKHKAHEEVDENKAEFLDVQTIREGMLLLGCIIEVRSDRFLMSLPGCLVGTVSLTNISRKYTEVLKNCTENIKSEMPSLESIFELGSVFPCKVLQVILHSSKKPTIILSIDPQDVNCNLKLQSLYRNMVLYAAVLSIEDHGYVLDIGIKGLQGFLPFNASASNNLLSLGQVIPTYLKKLPSQKTEGNAICLTGLSFTDTFPEIADEDVKLSAILPGSRVSGYISEVNQSFIYMKCFSYNAFATTMSCKNPKDDIQVSGTVLYVHPITNSICLHLGNLPSPTSFQNYFNVKKYDRIKNLRFTAYHHNRFFFKYHNLTGYIKTTEVDGQTRLTHDALIKKPLLPKARVVFLHYMDNMVQLTFKEALLKMKIVKPDEVEIGNIYEAIVRKHMQAGMFVSICPGLSGFIRHAYFSDSFITMPEKLYPVGAKINCRVLSIHPALGVNLTCKESLMTLPSTDLLKSYEDAMNGKCFKGVIIKKTEEYILILFFNNIQGIVLSEDIPKSSVFFVGQTVMCVVLKCDPLKRKLKLSLCLPCRSSVEELSSMNGEKNIPSSKHIKDKIDNSVNKPEVQKISKLHLAHGKLCKAIIKKVTAHQLNILVNGSEKGRIHITETGCSKEDISPLQQFSVGQQLKVYVLKEYQKQSRNYLKASHQNMTSFLECSLTYPSPVSLDGNFSINKPFIGFIKEIKDVYAVLWLSPYHSGILEYVNITQSPKDLRKLKKHLKVGQSLNISVLPSATSSNKDVEIKLTTPGIPVPDIGKNIVGLLTVASPDKELVLKLPHEYTGTVYVTDIQDVYSALQPLLKKYLKFKFILCHVIEVDHATKTCVLSLRKSRLYGKTSNESKKFSPEFTILTAEKGSVIKGYVQAIFKTYIILNIGRHIQGKVSLHNCSMYDCANCRKQEEFLKNILIGDVIDVTIDSTVSMDDYIPLSLYGVSNMDYVEDTCLNVKKDINWSGFQ